MNRLRKSILLFISTLPYFSDKTAAVPFDQEAKQPRLDLDPISLRPLNSASDNLFAAHGSHRSHASHRSSSGGGYSAPRERQSEPADSPAQRGVVPSTPPRSSGSQPTDPGRAAPITPAPARPKAPALTLSEKKTLQIMRVQIALNGLGLYTGQVNGVLDDRTKEALRRFQTVKGLQPNGMMTTETLNALAVPAVQ